MFSRRETRQAASQMAGGLLMELEVYNCWSIAEAVGHAPTRPQPDRIAAARLAVGAAPGVSDTPAAGPAEPG